MKTIFNEAQYNEIVERISKASGKEKAIWGKMSIAQAMNHCILPLEVATGTKTVKPNWIGRLLKGVIKKAILEEKPYKKNLATMPQYKVMDNTLQFEQERTKLLNALHSFKQSEASAEGRLHPVVGALSKNEWGFSQYKHLDHHLQQFGL
jgi:hypothetical protein